MFEFKILRNKVTGDGMNFEEAKKHYYLPCVNSIEELCQILNSRDIYGCGSSFDVEKWTVKN